MGWLDKLMGQGQAGGGRRDGLSVAARRKADTRSRRGTRPTRLRRTRRRRARCATAPPRSAPSRSGPTPSSAARCRTEPRAAPSDGISSVRRPMVYALLMFGFLALAGALVWLVRFLGSEFARLRGDSAAQLEELKVASGAQLAERSAAVDRRLRRGRRDHGPPARRARHEGRPPAGDGLGGVDADPRPARQARRGDDPDERAGAGARAARAGPAATEGARRLRRVAPREPPRGHVPGRQVRAPARLPKRRARRRGHQARPGARPGRREVPARQLPAHGRGGERRGARAPREGSSVAT